jgi:hypothetical protein
MHQSFSGAIRPGKVNMASPHAYSNNMAATHSIENSYFSLDFNRLQQAIKPGSGPEGRL